MNQKNNILGFEKDVNPNFNFKSTNQKDILKMKLMNKFNISPEEADKVISEILKKKNEITSEHVFDGGSQNIHQNSNMENVELTQKSFMNQKSHIDSDKRKFDKNELKKNDVVSIEKSNSQKDTFNNNGVNAILKEIIPNYNQQISIEVNHLDLTFEVQNEKIDTLKETFIRTLKRDKSKKLKIHALKDISFKIYKGEKVGIIGYNGVGKSTLLNVITGIYPPDKGNVSVYGKISPLLSLGAGFDHNFSGRKNIILNGAVLGYDNEYLNSKMDEIIEFSELGEFIDIPIKNYSAGMLAKLAFSIATSVNPDILIIDEILGVGDVNFQKKSADKIKSLMDGGTTVLLVSHSIPQIRELCDKAIWIDNGSLRAFGEVNKVCDEYLKDAEKASNEQLANIELFKN